MFTALVHPLGQRHLPMPALVTGVAARLHGDRLAVVDLVGVEVLVLRALNESVR